MYEYCARNIYYQYQQLLAQSSCKGKIKSLAAAAAAVLLLNYAGSYRRKV